MSGPSTMSHLAESFFQITLQTKMLVCRAKMTYFSRPIICYCIDYYEKKPHKWAWRAAFGLQALKLKPVI